MKQFGLAAGVVLAFVTMASAQEAAPPWKAKNVQYFPGDISREALTQRMREFSFALSVRCQYCHAGGDGDHNAGRRRYISRLGPGPALLVRQPAANRVAAAGEGGVAVADAAAVAIDVEPRGRFAAG